MLNCVSLFLYMLRNGEKIKIFYFFCECRNEKNFCYMYGNEKQSTSTSPSNPKGETTPTPAQTRPCLHSTTNHHTTMCKEIRKYFATYKVSGTWLRTKSYATKKELMRNELWSLIEQNDNLQVTFQVERSYIDDTQK